MAAAAILKNPTRQNVVVSGQTVVDMSIYCIKVEWEVGYCEFVYGFSAIFLLPVSAFALFIASLQSVAPDMASVDHYGRV